MVVVRNPLNRNLFIRVNDGYDNQDVIVENNLSQKKQFKDVEKTDQLTQNSWNLSPYTRSDSYRDVTISNPIPVGRIERQKTPNTAERYHNHEVF